jgi:retron-type reverse transcriptase
MELALNRRGEAPTDQRSGEASTTSRGPERSEGDRLLMEQVVGRANALAALKRVKQNKGGPGVDGMTVEALTPYLVAHWAGIREHLLAGLYRPQAVKRQDIPKPGGGTRTLGIPTVLDRFIQQCLLQVLQPRFDPTFSEHSYGFRPGRSAHDAVRAAQRYIQSGRNWVADVDLAKFFDRVNHDTLMERHEGTPQGGPLSPLLANVLLDEVDKELEKRGLTFARYADDLNVYTGSKRSAEDAMATLKRLFARLRLQVNDAKSSVARAWERKFLGYSFWVAPGRVIRLRVAPAALVEMKDRVRLITSRSGGRSLAKVAEELRDYLSGWKRYFQLAETPGIFHRLDQWLHHRLRAVQLKQWKRGSTTYRELRVRQVPDLIARAAAAHTRRWWATAAHWALHSALPTSYFDRLGVPRLASR